jgi:hypothetical protein
MMRHMVFVGFSLRDDNFHRIADAVRRARSPSPRPAPTSMDRFGTALELFSDPLAQALWASDLDWVTMSDAAPPSGDDAAWAAAARRLEIFLDAVLAKTGTTAHLLDPRYAGALTTSERALAARLGELAEGVERDRDAASAAAWKPITNLLLRLGWARDGVDPRRRRR